MITAEQRERLEQVAAIEKDFERGWAYFRFQDTLTADELEQLLEEPEMDGILANKKEELREEIADRRKLEELARRTNWSFTTMYPGMPHMEKLLESLPHQCAFLRACECCNTSHRFLAHFTESILAEHASGVMRVERRFRRPEPFCGSGWDDRPRDRSCLTMSIITRYTQRAPNSYRDLFFPEMKRSGGAWGCGYFDWNEKDTREW